MPRPKSSTETERLSLSISKKTRERLEDVQTRTEAPSLSTVVQQALALYDTLSEETARGNEVIVRDPKSGKENRLLMLSTM